MKIAFLEPLSPPADTMPPQIIPEHEVLVAPSAESLPDGWQDVEAVVWSRWPVDAAMIAQMPRLRFMQRLGVFRANGDVTAALERGIPVSVLAHGTAARVAEHNLALILGLMRGLLASHAAVVRGDNPANMEPMERIGGTPTVNWARVPGLQTLHLKTIGIAGFGEIGANLALMLKPFNCRVLYNKRTPLSAAQEAFYGVQYASLDEVLEDGDVVVDLLPTTDATRGALGARQFALMKETAFFVNTGRGVTIDEDVLLTHLRAGLIAGAGLDVFALEPLPPGHPFTTLPNVLLTPHTAGGTPQGEINGMAGWTDTFERIGENIRRLERGQAVINPLRLGDPQPGVES
jgi:phosphoglycerate dehydrogenase-like enzyme